ncbi:MAG: SagB/ThcOx family dehydrogenase [Erysipelotrichaceae bacterium]|jgi:SagB-type dehydrogenase family enzyme|nr:SagB/ThcOx family dehydrogenase [Erysipelotrichaceae bacterium]
MSPISKEEKEAIIQKNREFLQFRLLDVEPSDQEKKLPQPPLYKDPKEGAKLIDLPKNYRDAIVNNDFLDVIDQRKSDRVYSGETITLLQLSYLLWATQGVKAIRGQNYATIRTVPCGGARHEFECYLLVINVEGLAAGTYHYLPETHQLEFLKPVKDAPEMADILMRHQSWVKHSSVQFFWSLLPYRAEWRYSVYAHRIILVDIGHVGENLYLAATALGLGTCGIGAFDQKVCDDLFDFEGTDESTIYSATIGVNVKVEKE